MFLRSVAFSANVLLLLLFFSCVYTWIRITLNRHKKGGVLDIDTSTISTITSHAPGYVDQGNEIIIGLQTDAPLKRAMKPFGGIRTVEKVAKLIYGFDFVSLFGFLFVCLFVCLFVGFCLLGWLLRKLSGL